MGASKGVSTRRRLRLVVLAMLCLTYNSREGDCKVGSVTAAVSLPKSTHHPNNRILCMDSSKLGSYNSSHRAHFT